MYSFFSRLNGKPLPVKTGTRFQCMLGRKPRTIHVDSNNASISAISFVKQSKTDILYQSPPTSNSIKGVATNGQNGYH